MEIRSGGERKRNPKLEGRLEYENLLDRENRQRERERERERFQNVIRLF